MAYETEHSLSTGQPNNSTAQANLLGDGVVTIGALGSASDVDYYKIVTTGPSLINLSFVTSITSSSTYWNIGLLDSSGLDYLVSSMRSLAASPQINGASQSDTTLDVKGLSSLPASGSRFTIATSGADTTIYTVISSSALSSGSSTLTLDKAVTSPADGAYLIFDPVTTSVGASTTLHALVEAAGTCYIRVAKADVASSQEYSLMAAVTSTLESDFNDTKADAAGSNNHLLEGVAMTGNLSDDQDKDVWLFTTAKASDFAIDFAAPGGSAAASDWKVTVTDWNGQGILNNNGASISLEAGTSASATISQAYNPVARTYLVLVEAAKTGVSTGNYTLKVSGTALDLNDTPLMTIGSVSSSASNTVINTGIVRSIQAGTDSFISLSGLFSSSDADTAQTLSYVVSLAKPAGSGTTGYLKAGTLYYGFGVGMVSPASIVLSSSEMAAAQFYSGMVTGDLTLTLQVRDSSGASDGSDYGAYMQQTLRVVNAGYAVNVSSNSSITLQEGNSSSTDSLSMSLGIAPSSGETVTLYLEHGGESASTFQLSYSSAVLTFNSSNWNQVQRATVFAREDGFKEGTQTGTVSFRVVSSEPASAFNNLLVNNLTYLLTDASNHVPTGSVTVTGIATQGQTLTAANTLADADGLGTVTYLWQQSADEVVWSTIAGSGNGATHTLANAQADKYIRALANYTDALSNAESVGSNTLGSNGVSLKVSNINDAPTVANTIADQVVITGGIYSFTIADNTFSDIDPANSGGTLTCTATLDDGSPLPAWLLFNSLSRTFSSANVTASASSSFSVKVTATDNATPPLWVSDTFTLTINSALPGSPRLATALLDQTATQGAAFSCTIAAGSFTDSDNSISTVDTTAALVYTATLADGSSLPTWLNFASANGLVFSGTPGNADVGSLSIKVTASDGTYAVSDIFNIVVANVNDLPTGSVAIGGTPTQGNTLTASNTLADIDGMGTVFYQWQWSSDGAEWSSTPGANSTTLQLAQAQVGKMVRVVAGYTDARGTVESKPGSATAVVLNINDSPVAVADAANALESGGVLNGTAGINPSGNVLSNDTDPDTGDTKMVSAISGGAVAVLRAGSYGSLVLNADGSYSYTVDNGNFSVQALPGSTNTLTDTFTYTVRDTAGLTSSANLSVTLHGANDAPVVAVHISDPSDVYAGNSWTPLPFSGNTFADVDAGDTLTYTAAQSDGSSLPSWLAFHAATRTFSSEGVTVPAGTIVKVMVTATDSGALSVSDTFTITVQDPGSDAPILTTPTPIIFTDTGTADTVQTLLDASSTESGVLAAAPGSHAGSGDVLTYGISGGATGSYSIGGAAYTFSKVGTYGALYLNTVTGAYTFMPDAPAVNALNSSASESFTVTVTDTALVTPLTTTKLLLVNVVGANDTPTLAPPPIASFTDTVDIDTVTTLIASAANRTGFLAGLDADARTVKSYGIFGGTDSGVSVTKTGLYSTLVVTKESGAYTLVPNADALNAIAYNTSESFTVLVNDGISHASNTLTVNLVAANDPALNEVPRLTSLATLSNGIEDTASSISFEALLGGSDAADIEGQSVSFRIEALLSGSLTRNGVAVISGDTFGAGQTLVWIPEQNANGTIDVVAVKAIDAQGAVSAVAVPVRVAVTAVNDAPTGGVTISGKAIQGTLLTAHHTLADADGPGTIHYQWQAAGMDIPGAVNDTYQLTASEAGKSILVKASYTDGSGTPESVASGATGVVVVAGYNFSGVVQFWKNGAGISGVTTSITSSTSISQSDGSYNFQNQPVGDYRLDLQKNVDGGVTNAITTYDALSALKISVALNPNIDGAAVTPYQYMAADVDRNGVISPTDALLILQKVVKLPSASLNEWLFVPATLGSASMSRSHVDLPIASIPVTLDQPTHLQLIGIISGDVDGDWSAV